MPKHNLSLRRIKILLVALLTCGGQWLMGNFQLLLRDRNELNFCSKIVRMRINKFYWTSPTQENSGHWLLRESCDG